MDNGARKCRKSWEEWGKGHLDLYTSVHRSSDPAQLATGARDVIKKLSLAPGGKLLDVGCGSGVFLSEILKLRKLKAVGVDISEVHIALAKNTFPDVEFFVASMEELPFKPESFDNVLSYGVFLYAVDWEKVLTEFLRVCKSGGRILIGDVPSARHKHMLYLDSVAGLLSTMFDIKRLKEKMEYLKDGAPFRWLDLDAVKRAVERLGHGCEVLAQPRHRQFESITYNYRFDILIHKEQ